MSVKSEYLFLFIKRQSVIKREKKKYHLSISTITSELNDTQAALKRTKEELQKSKRDLLIVKQQVNQQKQANERQLERLRSRFCDESIKVLRLNVAPQVNFAKEGLVSSISSAAPRRSEVGVVATSLERKQLEDLECKRKELIEYNAGLKRFATESLNLAREAANYLSKAAIDPQQEMASSSSSHTSSSSINIHTKPSARLSILYQRDLFPSSYPLMSDYAAGPVRGQNQHPAVDSLTTITSIVHHMGSRVLQSLAFEKSLTENAAHKGQLARSATSISIDLEREKFDQKGNNKLDEDEQDRLLNRALQRVEELEAEIKSKEKDAFLAQSRKDDREERLKQAAEVEKQRQRYLALCRELEKQEELLSLEREALQRQQEGLLCAEMSLSVQAEDSMVSSINESDMTTSISSLKRHRDDEKENERIDIASLQGKRPRMDQSTPTGNTMRFVTIRKQRGRLQ